MTEKGTKTLIGFFVMCALTLLIGGVMIVGSGSFSSAARFVCFFDASLRGLLPGSPVYFRGGSRRQGCFHSNQRRRG